MEVKCIIIDHTLACSFQTCFITERVASFQQRDDLSSVISLSAGSLALAADLRKLRKKKKEHN